MEPVDPTFKQICDAVMTLLAAGMDDVLEAFGQASLAPGAFAPVVQGTPNQDTVCAAYSGARRDNDTYRSRDNEIIITLNIWAFGANDRAAQDRAIALEAAALAVLDCEENRYLSGACDAPITIGNTHCLSADDANSSNLMWRLAFPILCPRRTAKPEIATEL